MIKRAFVASICACLTAWPAFAAPRTHIVRYRETAQSIADTYGVSVQELLAANHISNGRLLRCGRELVIPEPGSEVTATEAAPMPEAAAAEAPVTGGDSVHSVLAGFQEPARSEPAPAPARPGDLSLGTMLSLILKLGVVLALAYGASLALRRVQGRRLASPSGTLKVVESVVLGQHRSLHVVSVGSRRLLIGATAQQIGLLGDITRDFRVADLAPSQPQGPADDQPQPDDFTSRLLHLLQRTPTATQPRGGAVNGTGEYRRPAAGLRPQPLGAATHTPQR